MRIPTTQNKLPYFNRRDQFRMLMMVAALGCVIFSIKMVGKPSFWYWILPPETEMSQQQPEQREKINYRVQLDDDRPLQDDEFRTPATPTSKPTTAGNSIVNPEDYSIKPEILEDVEDNKLGVRIAESAAYFAILKAVSEYSLDELEQHALKDVPYASLMVDSAYYRGKLVHLKGQARRVLKLQVGANRMGIEKLYVIWMFTAGSGKSPIKVVCGSIPAGMPTGEAIEPAEITVTGYFFKREGYESNNGLYVAPLILAQQPIWHQPVVEPQSNQPGYTTPIVIGIAAVVITGVCFLMWRLTTGDRKFDAAYQQRNAEESEAAVAELKDKVEYIDVTEMFEQMKTDDIDRNNG